MLLEVQHGNLAFGENSRALRLENALLRKPLSNLRAANANPIVRRAHEMGSRRVGRKRTGTSFEVPAKKFGNLAFGENTLALRLVKVSLWGHLPCPHAVA